MPTQTLGSQNGNSCAAHCTAISIWEIKGTALTQHFAENDLWPTIQFVDEGGASTLLSAAHNSDPRRIVSQIQSRWPGVNAKLMCDQKQKTAAMAFVATAQRPDFERLFDTLADAAVEAPVQLDELVYYNCSYTMHNAGTPGEANFRGMHNIMVVYQGGKAWYYNPNEAVPSWRTTGDWKKLENQNGGTHSYVFTGVSVAIF